jgi:oligopeptidase B
MTINSYTIDLVGRRIYTLEVKNLITGEILSDKIKNTTGNSTWAGDNKTISILPKMQIPCVLILF